MTSNTIAEDNALPVAMVEESAGFLLFDCGGKSLSIPVLMSILDTRRKPFNRKACIADVDSLKALARLFGEAQRRRVDENKKRNWKEFDEFFFQKEKKSHDERLQKRPFLSPLPPVDSIRKPNFFILDQNNKPAKINNNVCLKIVPVEQLVEFGKTWRATSTMKKRRKCACRQFHDFCITTTTLSSDFMDIFVPRCKPIKSTKRHANKKAEGAEPTKPRASKKTKRSDAASPQADEDVDATQPLNSASTACKDISTNVNNNGSDNTVTLNTKNVTTNNHVHLCPPSNAAGIDTLVDGRQLQYLRYVYQTCQNHFRAKGEQVPYMNIDEWDNQQNSPSTPVEGRLARLLPQYSGGSIATFVCSETSKPAAADQDVFATPYSTISDNYSSTKSATNPTEKQRKRKTVDPPASNGK